MVEKLRQLKEKSGMTNQQIAEKSNLPESTVARIFSGKTPNPTIVTAVSMARAMGGTAADFMGEVETEAQDAGTAPAESSRDVVKEQAACTRESIHEYAPATERATPKAETAQDRSDFSPHFPHFPSGPASFQKYYEDIILLYESAIKKKDKWIARLFWCLLGIMLFILFTLIFDITHPHFGFVKY